MGTPLEFNARVMKPIFKRDDIRGIWPDQLNAEAALLIGQSLVAFFRKKGVDTPRIAVAHDARRSSLELLLALCRGIRDEGGKPVNLGLGSTEHLYFATGSRPERLAGGAMITASHNPVEYNGIKLVQNGARPFSEKDLEWLQKDVYGRIHPLPTENVYEAFAALMLNVAGIRALNDAETPQLTVVVAAGNGVGAVCFEPIARALAKKGIRVTFTGEKPDGDFPDGIPNPLDPEYTNRLAREVTTNQADLGICFDGDADRAGFVDRNGVPIVASQILALIAEHMQNQPGNRKLILRNLCCSQLLVRLFGPADGETLLDTPVGHGKIKLLIKHPDFAEKVLVAGEHSGHYFYPAFFGVDSGILTALHMIMIALKAKQNNAPLEQKLETWRQTYHWSGEINFKFQNLEKALDALRTVYNQLTKDPAVKRHEIRRPAEDKPYRVLPASGKYNPRNLDIPDLKLVRESPDHTAGWWLVLRFSGSEPKMRLNHEAWGPGAANTQKRMLTDVRTIIEKKGGTEA